MAGLTALWREDSVRGALWMTAASVMIAASAICVRQLSGEFSAFQLVFLRSLIGTVLLSPWMIRMSRVGTLRTTRLPLYLRKALTKESLILLGYRHMGLTLDIVVGSVLGTLMFLNVWLIIWPNQKIVIASNEQIKAGGDALPEAAAAAPKAALASRTNTLFSIPMLFFMGSSAHFAHGGLGGNALPMVVALVIIIALELNAIFGKQGPMTTVRGVIVSGLVLTAVLWAVVGLLN